MNCCNDFGECKQGHGCPARETHEALFHADKTLTSIGICGATALALLSLGAGYLLGTFLGAWL